MSLSPGRLELFCLFVACSYTSMEATVLSYLFGWIWSCIPKVLWNNKSPISLERVEWFCWFLHLVICILLDINWSYKNMLFWVDIFRHRLSVNHIVRCFKLRKLENYMRYQVEFLLLLKLQKILCYFGLWPQNTLGQSVCRIFYFWLVWHVNLITVGPLIHCTCYRHFFWTNQSQFW